MNVNSIIHSRSLRGSLIVGSMAGLAFLLAACGGSGGAKAPAAASAALATPTKAAASAVVTKPVTETSAVTSTVKTEAAPAKTAAVTETKTVTEAAPAKTAAVTETKVMTEAAAAAQTAAMTETKATTETNAAAAVVMLHDNGTHGKILTDGKGMALYIFDMDSKDKSTCTGDCLTKWLPLTVAAASDLKAGEGITGKLATIKREDDGKLQVTINGMPLYYYFEDKQPSDAKGQAVGDVWWLVGAEGSKISK